MSLDHSESIPVDTHIWKIALRDYGFNKRGKSLTAKLYIEVGDHFRLLFGDYSGWAHSVSIAWHSKKGCFLTSMIRSYSLLI
jgi:N-glycosylase/DNA lyase